MPNMLNTITSEIVEKLGGFDYGKYDIHDLELEVSPPLELEN